MLGIPKFPAHFSAERSTPRAPPLIIAEIPSPRKKRIEFGDLIIKQFFKSKILDSSATCDAEFHEKSLQ